jgi:hypothetical protein
MGSRRAMWQPPADDLRPHSRHATSVLHKVDLYAQLFRRPLNHYNNRHLESNRTMAHVEKAQKGNVGHVEDLSAVTDEKVLKSGL